MTAEAQSRAFMERALELASQAWGETYPNPMVGAVIVEQGKVVAEGWHAMAGQPHAEIEALRALGRQPGMGATLYVTLEPCSTRGYTGACTDAILQSGIQNLVVGAIDPNPDHAGRGIERLRAAGIQVIEGVLADECRDLNLVFNHWIVQKQPLIAMKVALTLDGKFAAASGDSKWVTGKSARLDVMRWRRYFPAIAVGANTVLQDDPALTSRIDGSVWCPRRFVLDRTLRTVRSSFLPKLYNDTHKESTTVLCSSTASREARSWLTKQGVNVWELPEKDGHLDIVTFRERCAVENIYGVYFEAGPEMAANLLQKHFIDYAFVYKAPKIMNDSETSAIGFPRSTKSMEEALTLRDIRHKVFGNDVLIRGQMDYIKP